MARYRKKIHYPKDWTEVYELPLHLDNYISFAWTADGEMALSSFKCEFDEDGEFIPGTCGKIEDIIRTINGEIKSPFDPDWSIHEDDPCAIMYKGEFQFLVRGWGHLTGIGALNLPTKLAAELQDQFIQYILNRLNGNL